MNKNSLSTLTYIDQLQTMIKDLKSDRLKAYKTICKLIECKEQCECMPWECEKIKAKFDELLMGGK